jgi:two-component system sensor histidine kinase/response regulator
MRHCVDNPELYKRMVQQFCATMVDAPQRIVQALQSNAQELALREAHTLRGVSANIGAMRCRDLAEQIESALAAATAVPQVLPLVDALESHLADLVLAMRAAFPLEKQTAPAHVAIDRDQLGSVCRELAGLLEACEARSENCMRDNAALLREGLGSAFDGIQAHIENFDFSAAFNQLVSAAETARIPLR